MKRLLFLMMTTILVLTACGGGDVKAFGKPSDINNDETGKWKKSRTSENIGIVEEAPKYREAYMKDGDVHFIIDFNKRNTYQLNYMGGTLYLDVHEYVDKEEHDAKVIGGGMLLKSYEISDDGSVEEIN